MQGKKNRKKKCATISRGINREGRKFLIEGVRRENNRIEIGREKKRKEQKK